MTKLGKNTLEKDGNRLAAFMQGNNQGAGVFVIDNYLDIAEQGSTPATPDAGYGRVFESSVGYLKFINDAGLNVHLGDVYHDLRVGTGILHSATILGWGTWAMDAWTFNQTGNQYIQWTFKLPSGWAGKTLGYVWLWGISSAGSGNIRWYLEAGRVANGVALPSVADVSQYQDIAVPANLNEGKIDTGAVSLASWVDSDHISIRFGRDGDHANDTFGQSGRCLGLRIYVY